MQDNHSRSEKGTLRRLHFQLRHAQAKLCRVVEGEVLNVAVDIRIGSPTFGKWTSVLLSAERQNQIYIPKGFAHGFVALSDTVQFLYKCSDVYDPTSEYRIIWNEPDLGISWGIANPLGLPLIARRANPITADEYPTPAKRPAYSVLSNARLSRTFSLQFSPWRVQLHSIFAKSPAETR